MEPARMAATDRSFHGIIGRSAARQALFAEGERFAPVDVPILIRGESGPAKELVATAVRRLSARGERPRLRARREDIELLVEHFRVSVNLGDGLGLDIKGVAREAMAVLEADDWPGNVRELEAVVKRAMVCRRAGWVGPEDIVLPRLR